MDNKSQVPFEEFVKFCNIFLAKANYSKRDLAEKLAVEYTSFSKMYNGARPIPAYLLEKLKKLCEEPISPTPEKIAIQEQLPLSLNQAMQEIAKIQAIQDRSDAIRELDRKENLELRERVAILEKDLERSKNDGEKKIYELESRVAYAIRTEIEQLKSRLPRAANDR